METQVPHFLDLPLDYMYNELWTFCTIYHDSIQNNIKIWKNAANFLLDGRQLFLEPEVGFEQTTFFLKIFILNTKSLKTMDCTIGQGANRKGIISNWPWSKCVPLNASWTNMPFKVYLKWVFRPQHYLRPPIAYMKGKKLTMYSN